MQHRKAVHFAAWEQGCPIQLEDNPQKMKKKKFPYLATCCDGSSRHPAATPPPTAVNLESPGQTQRGGNPTWED
ncbi:hypothetical protein FKM82_009365 [Ascaphus truei]